MEKGDKVVWSGIECVILLEMQDDYFCIATGDDSAQLVHKSELEVVQ